MTSYAMIIACDPGINGGVAATVLDSKDLGRVATTAFRTPTIKNDKDKSEIDIRTLALNLAGFRATYAAEPIMVVIENVHSVRGQGIASSFTFGRNYGEFIGFAKTTYNCPIIYPSPVRWQKELFGAKVKSLKNKAGKRSKTQSIEYVKSKYQSLDLRGSARAKKVHDGIAEALCLLDYGVNVYLKSSEKSCQTR